MKTIETKCARCGDWTGGTGFSIPLCQDCKREARKKHTKTWCVVCGNMITSPTNNTGVCNGCAGEKDVCRESYFVAAAIVVFVLSFVVGCLL